MLKKGDVIKVSVEDKHIKGMVRNVFYSESNELIAVFLEGHPFLIARDKIKKIKLLHHAVESITFRKALKGAHLSPMEFSRQTGTPMLQVEKWIYNIEEAPAIAFWALEQLIKKKETHRMRS